MSAIRILHQIGTECQGFSVSGMPPREKGPPARAARSAPRPASVYLTSAMVIVRTSPAAESRQK